MINCKFWEDLISNPKSIIINGHHYIDGGKDQDYPLGFSGRVFNIIFNNGEVLETNNLFHQGKIPDSFRFQLVNNAKFMIGNYEKI